MREGDAEWSIVQEPEAFTLMDIKIGKKLGKGAYGEAWTCLVKGREFVIKLPHHVQLIGMVSKGEEEYRKIILGKNKLGRRLLECQGEFKQEVRNYERIVEPRAYVALSKGKGYVNFSSLGPHAGREAYREYARDMAKKQAHPGFHHLHRLFHFDCKGNIPFILSERCDDSLGGMATRFFLRSGQTDLRPVLLGDGQGWRASKLWRRIAKHLTSALDFMLTQECVNVDIKPFNVLYVVKDGELHFMIADYGMCENVSSRPCAQDLDPLNGECRGTPAFNPPEEQQETMMSGEIAIYQVMTTLISVIDCERLPSSRAYMIANHLDRGGIVAKRLHDAGCRDVRLCETMVCGDPLFALLYEATRYEPECRPQYPLFEEWKRRLDEDQEEGGNRLGF